MSLLMQALKKAERAQQNALSEEDQDKPSAAFDEVLALTPASAPAPAKPATATELSLEPMDGFSLEPLAPPVAAATTEPRPSPSPLPAVSDHKAPGLTMDLALDPVVAPPAPAASTGPAATAGAGSAAGAATGVAAGANTAAKSSATATATATTPRSASATQGSAPVDAGTGTGTGASTGARRGAAASTPAAGAGIGTSAGKGTSAGTGASAGSASRTRARAATTAEPSGLDPERLRLIGLIALLVLVVGGFGIYYWRALTAPGAGAGLPPVPMPPPGATGATPGPGMIIAAGPAASTDAGAAAADDTDPMLAPSSAGSSRVQQELERRLAKTEQDLATAQQTIQAVAAANAPRPEQMPVLAAPDNSDIRVSRAQQTSPVAPALDSAYQAFNSGDLGAAQQQYAAALAQDANNRDALLGAAHVAARQNQKDQAAAYYLRLLELSPNDADATAGLIGLRQGDISLSEARLKTILVSNPEAGPVLFTLGNLYAQQGRWSDAQQSYFRAVGAAPDNPDYAYNLAIGLDRLNQTRLALGYYQRALALAQDKAVGFDRNALRQRMHELGGAPKQ